MTPLSPDFTLIVNGAASGVAATGGPLTRITWLMVSLWRALPIDHPNVIGLFKAQTFEWAPGSVALVILAKLPLIILDLSSALLLYRFAFEQTGSKLAAQKASLLWLFNPYVIFLVEMWGSLEILAISLALLAFWLLTRGKKLIGSVAFAVSIASRLLPSIFLVGLLKEHLHRKAWRWLAVDLLIGFLGAAGYLLWSAQGPADLASQASSYNHELFIFDEFAIFTSTISVGLASASVAVTWLLVIQFWNWNDFAVIPASLAAVSAFLAFYNWHPAALLWPLAFLVLCVGNVTLGARPMLLVIVGALFALSSSNEAILGANAIFFVPVPGASSFEIVKNLKQFFLDDLTQLILVPTLRALFAALAISVAASIHLQNGVTWDRVKSEIRLGE